MSAKKEAKTEQVVEGVQGMAAAARGAGADHIKIEILDEDLGSTVVVRDNGEGMTHSEFEFFFQSDYEFNHADEVVVTSTSGVITRRATSYSPPEYQLEELPAEGRDDGTRIELRRVFAGESGIAERISKQEILDALCGDRTAYDVDINLYENK